MQRYLSLLLPQTKFLIGILIFVFSLYCAVSITPASLSAQAGATPSKAIGTIDKPPGTSYYVSTTNPKENQLLPFISTLLTVAAVFAGLWVLANFFIAGYTALSSNGDAASMDKVKTAMTNSVMGLLLIILAYTMAALVGTIFFGDAGLFTQPHF